MLVRNVLARPKGEVGVSSAQSGRAQKLSYRGTASNKKCDVGSECRETQESKRGWATAKHVGISRNWKEVENRITGRREGGGVCRRMALGLVGWQGWGCWLDNGNWMTQGTSTVLLLSERGGEACIK